jgi:hypothetical protein
VVLLITWLTGEEVPLLLLLSPPYAAVILWLPRAKVEVEKVACPEPLSVPVPIVVAPSLKVTVPVAVPLEPVTVAVKVTDWPVRAGFADEPSATIVLALLTV